MPDASSMLRPTLPAAPVACSAKSDDMLCTGSAACLSCGINVLSRAPQPHLASSCSLQKPIHEEQQMLGRGPAAGGFSSAVSTTSVTECSSGLWPRGSWLSPCLEPRQHDCTRLRITDMVSRLCFQSGQGHVSHWSADRPTMRNLISHTIFGTLGWLQEHLVLLGQFSLTIPSSGPCQLAVCRCMLCVSMHISAVGTALPMPVYCIVITICGSEQSC